MKKLLLALAGVMVLGTATANEKRDSNRLLKCVRETINDRRMNDVAIKKTFDLLASYGERETKDLLKECKANDKAFRKNEKTSFEDMAAGLRAISVTSSSSAAQIASHSILHRMINTVLRCHVVGAEVDVAFGFGIGFGAGVGKCKSSDGRNWGVFMPTISGAIGGGFVALVTKSEFTIYRGDNKIESDLEFVGGVLFAAKEGKHIEGYGLGLGFMLTGTSGIALKVLPIGNDMSELREELENPSQLF